MKPDSTKTVYAGKLVDLTVERWGVHEREIVEHPGSVAVLAIDADGYVTLVRQLREPARRHLLELPAGGLEPGEQPLETARRELAEETGLSGGDWSRLARFYTTPGFCREEMHLFLAEGVGPGASDVDDDEHVELVRWHVDELERRLAELEDAKTLLGIVLFLRRR